MPDDAAIRTLKKLASRASDLRDQEPLSADFQKWQRDTLNALHRVCDTGSEDVEYFEKLRFRVGAKNTFIRGAKKMAEEVLGEEQKISVNGGARRDHRGGVRRDRLAAAGLSP